MMRCLIFLCLTLCCISGCTITGSISLDHEIKPDTKLHTTINFERTVTQ